MFLYAQPVSDWSHMVLSVKRSQSSTAGKECVSNFEEGLLHCTFPVFMAREPTVRLGLIHLRTSPPVVTLACATSHITTPKE